MQPVEETLGFLGASDWDGLLGRSNLEVETNRRWGIQSVHIEVLFTLCYSHVCSNMSKKIVHTPKLKNTLFLNTTIT